MANPVLCLGVDRRLDIARQFPVDRRGSVNAHFGRNQKAGRSGSVGLILLLHEAALRSPQNIVAARVQVQRRALRRAQQYARAIAAAAAETLLRSGVCGSLRDRLSEMILEDDVHDLLVWRIAVFESDLFRKD